MNIKEFVKKYNLELSEQEIKKDFEQLWQFAKEVK